MLRAVKGYYDKGHVFLTEQPPVMVKTDVIVTFMAEEPVNKKRVKGAPGGLKGKVSIPDDFNEPLDDLKEYM